MKRLLVFLCVLVAAQQFCLARVADTTVQVSVQLPELKKQKLYMGSYFGKFQTVLDSIVLNEAGEGAFKATKKYVSGIYFLATQRKELIQEFLMDNTQHFSLRFNSLTAAPQVSGSEDNTHFVAYNTFLADMGPKITSLKERLSQAKSRADSTLIGTELAKAVAAIEEYRSNFKQKQPNSLLSFLFQASARPNAPDKSTIHSAKEWYTYYQTHYWEGVSLSDSRLLRTPFFDQKLEEYLTTYCPTEPQELIVSIEQLLKQSGDSNGDCFKYLLSKLTDRYVRPTLMGQDKVFVYLFTNYYSKANYTWLSAEQKKYIFDRGYSLLSNQLGSLAPALRLTGINGSKQDLYTLKAPLTLLVFWDPNCSHCIIEIPKIDSLYRREWKAKGMRIFGVNIDEQAQVAWKAFIEKHQLSDWLHAYQPEAEKLAEQKAEIPNYRQLYDVIQTPVLYLLDADKKIIAKNLDAKGMTLFIEQFSKR